MTYRCVDCGQKSAATPTEPCWRCAGERRLTATQRAYLKAVDGLQLRQFPHCDGNVLHARGECRYCSSTPYDRLHLLRARFNIAYSGALLDGDQSPCPSEAWRPVAVIDMWPGNRANPA